MYDWRAVHRLAVLAVSLLAIQPALACNKQQYKSCPALDSHLPSTWHRDQGKGASVAVHQLTAVCSCILAPPLP